MRGTLTSLLSGLFFILAGACAGAAETEDPEDWYRTSYASLWNDTPADDVEEILEHYAEEIATHEVDGVVSTDDRRTWLVEPMREWVAQGWLRAELTALDTRRINATTASFIATWLDHYSDGSTEVSCGWYLADHMEGDWLFTAYADTDCP